MNTLSTSQRRWLLTVVAVLFVVKAAAALWILPAVTSGQGQLCMPDCTYRIGLADSYDLIAHNVASGHGYRFTPQTGLTMMREPGYPLFLAGLSFLFGNSIWIAVLANLVMSSISALLISRLAGHVFTERLVALVAPILFMIHPGEVVAELRSGVEVPFTLLLLCFFLIWRRVLLTERTTEYVLAGLVLGLTCNVRSAVLLFPFFLLLYQFARAPDWRTRLQRVGGIFAMMAALTLTLTPWTVRNYALVHKFIPTASVQGISMQVGFYQCTHSDTAASFGQLEIDALGSRLQQAHAAGYRFEGDYYQFFYDPNDEVRFNSSLQQQVVDSYVHSPMLLVKCASENAVNFWFRGKTRLATIGAILVQGPYLILALAGLLMGYRQNSRTMIASFLLLVVYMVAVCAPIHAEVRYSVPLIPILSLLAAIPVCRLLERLRVGRPKVAAEGT